jgi:hypothetical protein
MTNYNCEICDKVFNKLSDLHDHISSDNGCEIYLRKNVSCSICNSKFTSSNGLRNHINNIHKKSKTNDLEQELQKLKNRVHQIENIKRKPGRPKKINNNISGSHNIVNNADKQEINNINKQEINQQIIIVDYGNEDISKLTKDEKKAIINSKYDAIRKCTEILHCNPKYPEFRNISISNLRSNIGHQFKNGKFRVKSKDGLLEDLIRDKASNVQEILDEEEIKVSKVIKEKLDHLLSLIDEFDNEQIKTLKKELEYLLYEENKNIDI